MRAVTSQPAELNNLNFHPLEVVSHLKLCHFKLCEVVEN